MVEILFLFKQYCFNGSELCSCVRRHVARRHLQHRAPFLVTLHAPRSKQFSNTRQVIGHSNRLRGYCYYTCARSISIRNNRYSILMNLEHPQYIDSRYFRYVHITTFSTSLQEYVTYLEAQASDISKLSMQLSRRELNP